VLFYTCLRGLKCFKEQNKKNVCFFSQNLIHILIVWLQKGEFASIKYLTDEMAQGKAVFYTV